VRLSYYRLNLTEKYVDQRAYNATMVCERLPDAHVHDVGGL